MRTVTTSSNPFATTLEGIAYARQDIGGFGGADSYCGIISGNIYTNTLPASKDFMQVHHHRAVRLGQGKIYGWDQQESCASCTAHRITEIIQEIWQCYNKRSQLRARTRKYATFHVCPLSFLFIRHHNYATITHFTRCY